MLKAAIAIAFIELLFSLQANSQAAHAPIFEPVLAGNSYTVYVHEDTASGTVVTRVRARELIHETLVYSMRGVGTNHPDDSLYPLPGTISVFASDIYSINSVTGEIRVGGSGPSYIRIGGRQNQLNFVPFFTYEVTAWFVSNPGLTAAIRVTLISRDVNMAPSFVTIGRAFAMIFTQPVGYTVTRFVATDPDFGPAGEVVFSLEQVNPDENTGVTYFNILPHTGDLQVAHTLPEVHEMNFRLIITAQDEGDMPQSTSIEISVTIFRPSPDAPVFTAEVYTADVPEASGFDGSFRLPQFVVTVRADDPAHDTLNAITFFMETPQPENDGVQFAVTTIAGSGTSRGTVTLTGPVNRERESRYLLRIRASKVTVNLHSYATIVVHIEDVNETPRFLNSHYIAWVSEHTNIGEPLHASLSAVDEDEGQNGLLQYAIVQILGRETVDSTGRSIPGVFSIDSFTGVIYVNTNLERELTIAGIHYYDITVRVIDGGTPTGTGDTIVSVNVTDVNDNRPYFQFPHYTWSLQENLPARTLFTFHAFDSDERDHATLFFTIEGRYAERFYIAYTSTFHSTNYMRPPTQTTGVIASRVSFDREDVERYDLILRASDITFTPLIGYANVTIFILDENDNNPIIDGSFKRYVNFPECGQFPAPVQSFTVQDADNGTNAEMSFHLTSFLPGTAATQFSVTATSVRSADVHVTIPLMFDRESVPSIRFLFIATDMGTPIRSDSAELCITILDCNDNPPVIHGTYTATIYEDATITPLGTRLFSVVSTDRDIGNNAWHQFYIASGDGFGLFEIGADTGWVTTADYPDYEMHPNSINFELIVRDRGSPPLSATATATVSLCDCNDNRPEIHIPVDSTCIPENTAVGTVVRAFSTTDADGIGYNREHYFRATSATVNAAGQPYLCIQDRQVPEIRLCNPVDRETPLTYITITVEISNPLPNANLIAPFLPCGFNYYDYRSFNICVSGINDNDPFIIQPFSASIFECGALPGNGGAFVVRLQAFDNDLGENTVITFTHLVGGAHRFVIDQHSGTIRVTQLGVDREIAGVYHLSVRAMDNGGRLSNTVTVTVNINDCNDNTPMFTNPPYEVTIPENTPMGREVLRLQYTDGDLFTLAFRTVRIIFDGGFGVQFGHFIMSSDGIISVNTLVLDREQTTPILPMDGNCNAVYEFIVKISDNPGGTVILSSYTNVTILVSDENDNSPVFFPSNTNTITVAENNEPPTAIDHLVATDRDCGSNAELRYSIVSITPNPDPANPFFELISATDPTIVARRVLDREEHSTFTIIARATDLGTPPRSSDFTLTVLISDINDHNPILSCPADAMLACTYNVPEDTQVNTVIVDRITSTDEDATHPHNSVTYSITNTPTPPFSIDSMTGVISTTGLLDCETISEYYLTVVGTDAASTDPDHIRRGSIVVHIVCVDVNDNCPVWESSNMFTGSIYENMAAGTSVTLDPSIFASDADLTAANRVLSYTISDTTNFAMDSMTAELTTAVSFDREVTDTYTFTVTVTNAGCLTPDRINGMFVTITGTITITILDVNDNPPVWTPIPPFTFRECDTAANIVIYTLGATQVTDADINENAEIYYRFSEGHDEDFQIDYNTGSISIFQELDRERRDNYMFTIIATDGGDPQMSASTPFMLTVTDCNDNDPVCPVVVPVLEIVENSSTPITSLTTFLATDRDIGTNAQVTYSIVNGDAGGYFIIQSPSAQLTNTSVTIGTTGVPVDREAIASFTLTIQAQDHGATIRRSCTGQIQVNVRDINDHCPFIDPDPLNLPIDIPEDYAGNVEIVRLTTTDRDIDESNRIPVTFAIVSITPLGNDITIDSVSGGIHAQSIDFERNDRYDLRVSATDSGTPTPLSCYDDITIRITNCNDNPPMADNIAFDVCENTTEATLGNAVIVNPLAAVVVGTDLDNRFDTVTSRPPDQVTYSIIDGNIGNTFAIDPMTGQISIQNVEIDRETLDQYTLTIQLVDTGTQCINMMLTSTSTVEITVLDKNDNHPLIEEDCYFWNISEGSLPGQSFIEIRASDIDLDMNADICFEIPTNPDNVFDIDCNGHLRTITTLDREQTDYYEFTVMSYDMGVPVLRDSTLVKVNVTDINDNTPIIDGFENMAALCEHDPIGNSLFNFTGIDRDLGSNALFYFSLSDTHEPFPFALTYDGHLTIAADIDFESLVNRDCETPQYYLTVEIIDNGTNATVDHTRSSFGHINISVCDINDNIPRFTERQFMICIKENHTVGSSIYTFTATDDDCYPQNRELFFYIVGGDSASYFEVDTRTGTLSLAQSVDRETQILHEVFVAVTNYPIDPRTNQYELAMVSTTSVCVEDSNDNPPQCLLNPYVAAIGHDLAYGDEFATIITTDLDIGNHSVHSYELEDTDVPYIIDQDTGVMTTTALFRDKIGQIYYNRIRVYDNYGQAPSLFALCDIRVYVVSDEFRIIIIVNLPIEIVRENIVSIINIFQRATRCLIGIDYIRPRTSDDENSFQISQTDVVVHGIDPITFELKPRGPIIEIIDRMYSTINTSIHQAVGASVLEVRRFPVDNNDDNTNLLLVLWIVIAFLVAIAIVLCCCFICCYCWERRRRKLAHKELKSVVSLDQFEHTDTGVYQNPLWVQPYAEWQEESQSQEIVIDVDDEPVSEVNLIYASQELEIPVTQCDEEDSDDEQKNVQPPDYSNSMKMGYNDDNTQSSTKYSSTQAYSQPSTSYQEQSTTYRTSGYGGGADSYDAASGNMSSGGTTTTTTRTVSYKKTASYKRTVEVPETVETVEVIHTTSPTTPFETEDEHAGLLSDGNQFNFDED